MLKLVARRYLPLLAAVVLYGEAVNLYSRALLQGTLSGQIDHLSRGTLTLVEGRLKGLPRARWGEAIEALNRRFGYPIALKDSADLDPDEEEWARLRSGRVVYRREDNADLWYLPLANGRRYARGEVQVALWREGASAMVAVDDDGPGIPAEARERIFEPFARLARSRDRESGGYGLGLAIVRRIAELHGGGVAAEASPLGGARLRMWLPASPP